MYSDKLFMLAERIEALEETGELPEALEIRLDALLEAADDELGKQEELLGYEQYLQYPDEDME